MPVSTVALPTCSPSVESLPQELNASALYHGLSIESTLEHRGLDLRYERCINIKAIASGLGRHSPWARAKGRSAN